MKNFLKKNEKGQAMVEFALIMPILLVLFLGMVEFGQIFFSYLTIQNASRDGARYGSVGETDLVIEQIIQEKTSTLDQTNLNITISPAPSLRKRGEEIEVTINYQMALITPLWGSVLPNTFPISAKTVMRIE